MMDQARKITADILAVQNSERTIQMARSAAGYRKFSPADVARLRYVLSQQKDHYLPLRVIKDQLDAIDRGLVPSGSASGTPRVPHVSIAAIEDNAPTAEHFRPAPAAGAPDDQA